MKRVVVAAALLAMPSPSLAASPIGVGTPIEGPSTPTTGLEPGNRRALWSRGAHRWFVSSTIDAGYLLLASANRRRLRQAPLALRARRDRDDGLRRRRRPIRRPPLRAALRRGTIRASHARYLALDSELLLAVPAYRGSAFALVGAHRLFNVPDGYDVYEEQLRVVARPPWIYRARVGYALRLGEQGAIRLGPVVDVVHVPGRSATIIRGGLIATVVLTHQVEALATIIPTLVSPDRIGVAGGDFAQLGIRYRWATPEPPQGD